jgi:GT2 family glycosyltransferase
MPVYNAERYVTEAVESILAQTLSDFELLIVNDGSTDGTAGILRRYAARERRISLLEHAVNAGFLNSLNELLASAQGEFIARMDGDDAVLTNYLARPIDHFRQHPECVAVGCWVQVIDPDGEPIWTVKRPVAHEEIDRAHIRGETLITGLMARRFALVAEGGYRPGTETCEDLDLYLRLAERGRLANIPEALYKYRMQFNSISHSRQAEQARVLESVLRDARRRRRLDHDAAPQSQAPPIASAAETHRRWAWHALGAGNVATARKHARATLRKAPLAVESWRVLYCSLRGR